MSSPTVTISLSYTVPPQDAPELLRKLLAALPSEPTATTESVPPTPDSWPSIPVTAGPAYQEVADENLRHLRDGTVTDDGWGGVKDLPGVINSLRSETRKVVRQAIDNGGHISRDEVFELLDRDKNRSLKGFTKPIQSITERLISSGELSDDAKPLLSPIYPKSKTYKPAQGFAVPIQVVRLMTKRITPSS